MDEARCIIHYPQLKLKNHNKLITVTKSFNTIIEAKKAHQKLGPVYFHPNQCAALPDTFAEGLSYHYECYNNFMKAISQFRKKYPATDASTSTTVPD